MFSPRRCLASLLWLTVLNLAQPATPAEPPATAPAASEETWQAIAIRGQRIGYGRLVTSQIERDGQTVFVSQSRLHTVIKRFDGKLTLLIEQHVEEDAEGNLIRFTYRMENPPASELVMAGQREGDALVLQTTAGGQTTTTRLPVMGELKSPQYLDRLMETQPLPTGDSRTVQMFDPQVNSVLTVRATGRGPAKFTPPGGATQSGTHAVVEFLTGLPGVKVDVYFDADSKMVFNEIPLLGTATWTVTRDEALAKIPEDVDLGLAALLKVPRIPNASRSKVIVYRFTRPEPFAATIFTQDERQSPVQVSPNVVEVTVRAVHPGEAPPGGQPQTPPDAVYTECSSMARCDDPEIAKLARDAAPADAAPADFAVRAEQAVHRWLTRKNMSTNLATASEVVRSREGDCTEHAVLLAAVLRARQVPARVALGLVYWDAHSALAGHAWTEAWLNGRWVTLDATQATGGVGATHVKLSDANLAEGDAAFLAGGISTWLLLDQTTAEVVRVEVQE